jgi:dTDP-glucose 4,6-dehydratase
MKRILVTGGAGFIGTNFVKYWMKTYPEDEMVVYDALRYAGHLENLSSVLENPRFQFVQGDINDESLVVNVMEQHEINTVVHFAAESHVDRSIEGPDIFLTTNVMGTHSLLKAARRLWEGRENKKATCRFHHVSTDEVYGSLELTEEAWTEESPYAPNSPYAASKASSDHLVRAYHRTYGLPVTISHCSNNFGPYQYPEKLIPLMIGCILEGKPLPIYGKGLNVRDWMYVEDHCRGIDLILQKGRVGETYNMGGQAEWNNRDLVTLLCDLVDEKINQDEGLKGQFPQAPASQGCSSRTLLSFVADRQGHDLRYAINDKKACEELGYSLSYDFSKALSQTVDWYLHHQKWCRSVLNSARDK